MKLRYFILIFILLTVLYGFTDTPVPLQVWRTNGVVASPTNFWRSNVVAGTGIQLAPTSSNITVAVDTGVVAEISDLLWTNVGPFTALIADTNRVRHFVDKTVFGSNGLSLSLSNGSVSAIGYGQAQGALPSDSSNVRVTATEGAFGGGDFYFSHGCYVQPTEGAFSGAWFSDSTNCYILGFEGAYTGAAFHGSSNCFVDGTSAFAFGTFSGSQGSKDSKITASPSGFSIGYIEDSSNVFVRAQSPAVVIGGALQSANVDIHSKGGITSVGAYNSRNLTITSTSDGSSSAFALGSFNTSTNSSLSATRGIAAGQFSGTTNSVTAVDGFAFGSVASNERIHSEGGSLGALAFGRDVTSTNNWTFGIHYTNTIPFSLAVGANGTTQFRAASNSVVIRSGTAPTVGQILTATDTSGTVGWSNAPAASGGGIASIYTNNVLAGGPGLTELEFTNTATVTWTATTNAGRVTMSATSSGGGSGIATNAGTGWNTTIVGTLTNVGTIGQVAPLQQWNNSNSTQTISVQSNAVLVLQSNIVGVLFGPGASPANVGLKGAAGGFHIRKGDDSDYAVGNMATLTTWASGNVLFGRGSAPQNFGANNLGLFGWISAGTTELYNDTGTIATTNRIWGSRTNSTTGWWLEEGYSQDFAWHFLRSRSSHLLKPLALGIGTNWAFTIATNNFDTAGGAIVVNNTVDTTASTGMTINKSTGRVRLSAGNQTYLLTNNLATANSIVTATVNTDDANALSVKAIPAAGLITLKVNAATAANTDISFFISAP